MLKNSHFQCVKGLVFYDTSSSKLQVNGTNDIGDTALHMAAKWGYGESNSFVMSVNKILPVSLCNNMPLLQSQNVLWFSGYREYCKDSPGKWS